MSAVPSPSAVMMRIISLEVQGDISPILSLKERVDIPAATQSALYVG